MSEEVRSVLIWLHLTFAAIWIGAQVLTGIAVVPSVRRIRDDADRVETLRVFTRKFNLIAWGALALIVITGGAMTGDRANDIEDAFGGLYDARWGFIFSIKMALVVIMAALVALHAFVLGPRLMELNRRAAERVGAGEEQIRALKLKSGIVAGLGLLTSLLVLGCGAFLANTAFAFVSA